MSKKFLFPLLIGLSLTCLSPVISAHPMPTDAIHLATVIEHLHAKGYKNIVEIEFEHGGYQAEIINAEAREVKLDIDAKTHQVRMVEVGHHAKAPLEITKLSMLDAIKKVKEAGYHTIYKIKFEHNKYEVKALDKHNRKVEIAVNANTGKMHKDWF